MNFNLKFQKLKSNIQENDLGLHLVFRLGPEWGGASKHDGINWYPWYPVNDQNDI